MNNFSDSITANTADSRNISWHTATNIIKPYDRPHTWYKYLQLCRAHKPIFSLKFQNRFRKLVIVKHWSSSKKWKLFSHYFPHSLLVPIMNFSCRINPIRKSIGTILSYKQWFWWWRWRFFLASDLYVQDSTIDSFSFLNLVASSIKYSRIFSILTWKNMESKNQRIPVRVLFHYGSIQVLSDHRTWKVLYSGRNPRQVSCINSKMDRKRTRSPNQEASSPKLIFVQFFEHYKATEGGSVGSLPRSGQPHLVRKNEDYMLAVQNSRTSALPMAIGYTTGSIISNEWTSSYGIWSFHIFSDLPVRVKSRYLSFKSFSTY